MSGSWTRWLASALIIAALAIPVVKLCQQIPDLQLAETFERWNNVPENTAVSNLGDICY